MLEMPNELKRKLRNEKKRSFHIINNEAEKERNKNGSPADDLFTIPLSNKKKKVKKQVKRPLPVLQKA